MFLTYENKLSASCSGNQRKVSSARHSDCRPAFSQSHSSKLLFLVTVTYLTIELKSIIRTVSFINKFADLKVRNQWCVSQVHGKSYFLYCSAVEMISNSKMKRPLELLETLRELSLNSWHLTSCSSWKHFPHPTTCVACVSSCAKQNTYVCWEAYALSVSLKQIILFPRKSFK